MNKRKYRNFNNINNLKSSIDKNKNNLIINSAFSQSISQASSEKSIDNKFHKKFKSLSLKKIKKKN